MQVTLSPHKARHPGSDKSKRGSMARRATIDSAQFVGASIAEAPRWTRRLLLACTLALVATIGLAGYQSQGKVIDGIVVAGIPLGGLSYAEARALLEQRSAEFDGQRITLTYGETIWQPTLAELGITLDAESAWSTIVEFGSSRHVVDRALRTLRLRSGPIALGVPLRIDPLALEKYCTERMQELSLAPVNAELKVEGESILVTQDANGFVVSVDRLRDDLVRELTGFTAPTINLAATLTPASVRAVELEPDVQALGGILGQPLLLRTETDQWEIPPSQLAANVKLDRSSGDPSVVIDEEAISALVNQIAAEIDRPASLGHIDETGLYGRIVKPEDGVTVDREELRNRIEEAITTGSSEIEIPVAITPTQGELKSLLTDYGITDLIATGSSDFGGSDPGRAANVRRAAELIDGTLVAPGEIFSFNQALGSITDIAGFVPAGATEGGIPGTSVGGGVCQVSTSVFRAALAGGLPINEWYPHRYRSMYYEQDGWAPGFDASIQQPDADPLNGPDLKFRNITDGWLLVRVTATTGSELKVSLFGTSPGFDVAVADPIYGEIIAADQTPLEEVDDSLPAGTVELWQPARDGVTMIVNRTVYAADGSIVSDEQFVSEYQPQGPVYRVSADMAGTVSTAP